MADPKLSEQWKARLARIHKLYGVSNEKHVGTYITGRYMVLKGKKIIALNLPYKDAMFLLGHCKRMAERRAKDDKFDVAVMDF